MNKLIALSLLISLAFVTELMAGGCHCHSKHDDKSHAKKKKEFHAKGTQKHCPSRGKKIDPHRYVDYQQQRVYFCCKGCAKKFLKNPDAHFNAIKEKGEVAESRQKYCPVGGDKLEDHKIFAELPGRKIYFCCKRCMSKFNKSPKKFLAKMVSKKKKGSHKHDHDHSGSHKH